MKLISEQQRKRTKALSGPALFDPLVKLSENWSDVKTQRFSSISVNFCLEKSDDVAGVVLLKEKGPHSVFKWTAMFVKYYVT